MKKDKNVYMIIWGVVIGLSLLITIGCYVLNDTLEDNKDNNIEDKYTNTGNKDNDNSNDSSSLAVGYEAKTPEEFINYLNEYDYNKYASYAVSYDKIKVMAVRNEDKNGYSYKIYYNNDMLEYSGLETNRGKFYLLDDNQNKAFVLVEVVTPGSQIVKNLVLAFDINGNILMSDDVCLDNIEISNNTIAYSYQSGEIYFPDMLNECEFLEEWEDDYVVSGDKEIKYSNGELTVVKDIKKTIRDYKSSCK